MADFWKEAVCKDLLLLDTSKGGLEAVHAFRFRHRPFTQRRSFALGHVLDILADARQHVRSTDAG